MFAMWFCNCSRYRNSVGYNAEQTRDDTNALQNQLNRESSELWMKSRKGIHRYRPGNVMKSVGVRDNVIVIIRITLADLD